MNETAWQHVDNMDRMDMATGIFVTNAQANVV